MKKLFLLLSILVMSTIAFSQEVTNLKLDVVKDGLKIGRTFPKNIVANELKTLDGIDTTKTIREQFDETVQIADSVRGYDAADIDSLMFLYPKHVITDAVRKTHTGASIETQISSVAIPVGNIGVNGEIRIKAIFDATTGDTYNKTYTIKINGSVVWSQNVVNSTMLNMNLIVANRNSNTSKVVFGAVADGTSIQPNIPQNFDPRAVSIDTSSAITVTTHITLSNSLATGYQDLISIDTVK